MASRLTKLLISTHSLSGWMSPSSTYLLAPGAFNFSANAAGQLFAAIPVPVGTNLALEAGQDLVEHHLAVADDANVDRAGGRDNLDRIDVDTGDLGGGVEAGRRRMADNVVHARAEHDNEVGLLEGRRAHRQERHRMVVGQNATTLR